MIKNMLQAASRMLDDKEKPAATDVGKFMARVQCAKIIIDEIVAGMETEFPAGSIVEFDGPPNKGGKPAKKQPAAAPKTIEPEVGVDRNHNLVEIKNVPLDGIVEITSMNGTVSEMTHAQAIGKPFRDIKILWRPE